MCVRAKIGKKILIIIIDIITNMINRNANTNQVSEKIKLHHVNRADNTSLNSHRARNGMNNASPTNTYPMNGQQTPVTENSTTNDRNS